MLDFCIYCRNTHHVISRICISCRDALAKGACFTPVYCSFCGYQHNNKNQGYCPQCKKVFDNKNKGDNMNSIPKAIVKLFPKTEDAVIVDEYFHDSFNNNRIMGILAKGKEKEILAAAHHLDNEKRAKLYRK